MTASGRILTETLGNGLTTTKAYDALDRPTLNKVANGGTDHQHFTYQYDTNGNMTAGLGRTLTYTSYNMPAQVVGVGYSGGASTTYNYVYNAEHERTKLVHSTLGTFIYLHPAGKGQLLYEKQTEASPSTRIEHKYYISAGGASVAAHYARENPNLTETTTATRYLHQDHLGSITLITNEAGGVTERLAYEAYGKRRYPAGTDDPTNGLFGQVTDRGFTSHEHLDEIALIHMNGRVYDPVLGRFVTADPFLQHPDNLQDYNRYSYVNNNPLMYTDPSGYLKLGKIFRIAAAVAVAYFTGFYDYSTVAGVNSIGIFGAAGTSFATGGLAALGNAVVAGAALGGIGTGSWEGALKGAFSAGVFFGVGELGFAAGLAEGGVGMTALHAAAGCISSSASGGECSKGAASAGFAQAASPYLPGDPRSISRLVARVVVGGTASVLGGGKFENGAATASFAYLFNDYFHASGSVSPPTWAKFLGLDGGGGVGAAITYPGATGGEWDLVFYGYVEKGVSEDNISIPKNIPKNLKPIGSLAAELGYGFGGVNDIRGISGQLTVMTGTVGASISTQGAAINQYSLRFGGGLELSGKAVNTQAWSVREFFGSIKERFSIKR